jgi:hypothetical protein
MFDYFLKIESKIIKTNNNATLNTIFFIDKQNGWTAGEFGTILATKDCGKTWTTQKRGASQAKILVIQTGLKDATQFWISDYKPQEQIKQLRTMIEAAEKTIALKSPIKSLVEHDSRFVLYDGSLAPLGMTSRARTMVEDVLLKYDEETNEYYIPTLHAFPISQMIEEYSGENLTDELEAAANKLGFSLEDLR